MKTIDNLIDPSRRDITTVFPTGVRVNEDTYNAGEIRVALTTSHDKSRKCLETRVNREVVTDSGFVTRSFAIFGPASADAGIRLAAEPIARFNANKAREQHDFYLTHLALILDNSTSPIAPELRDLLKAAEAVSV